MKILLKSYKRVKALDLLWVVNISTKNKLTICQVHLLLECKVADEDLIAREFKMHEKCYRDYTTCSKQNTNSASNFTSSYNENDDGKNRLEYNHCQSNF